MVDAPELTSMTRRKTVRPLVAAWVFVIVILGTGFIWLSLSPEVEPTHDGAVAQMDEPDTPLDHSGGSGASEIDIADSHMPAAGDGDSMNIPLSVETENGLDGDHGHVPEAMSEHTNDQASGLSLVKAPIEGLVLMGANGLLPVLGPDSMVAWKEYARPSGGEDASQDERPKIAIIVTGIGLNSKSSALAIEKLPGEIDLGFSPYGQHLQEWMDKSRQAGHEGFLMIPTEPVSYPENDPGPHTLLSGASPRDNLKKLDWLLSQVTGYVGVINDMGSKFTTSEEDILPILEDLKGRGLMFLDARSTRFSVAGALARRVSMPRAVNNLYLDNVINSKEIIRNLTALENTARTYGTALGVARAFPLTIKEIEKWSRGLEARGLELVPVTAIANRQPIR